MAIDLSVTYSNPVCLCVCVCVCVLFFKTNDNLSRKLHGPPDSMDLRLNSKTVERRGSCCCCCCIMHVLISCIELYPTIDRV